MIKHSRPNAQTISDEQIIELICEMGESGISLKKACDEHNFVYRTVMNRIRSTEELAALDARARQDYARERARSLNEIANSEPDVARARLMCDNIKWEAARVLPKEFGDRLHNTHEGGDPDKPILTSIAITFVTPKPQIEPIA
jgi:terminase small subunit-like protein